MADQLSRLFAALADPTRRDMVARLAGGDATVSQLAEPYRMTRCRRSTSTCGCSRTPGWSAGRRGPQPRPVHLEAKVFDLMDKWIERYRAPRPRSGTAASTPSSRHERNRQPAGRNRIMTTIERSDDRGRPDAADHPHHPRLRGDARAAVPGPHRSRAVRPVGRTERHGAPASSTGTRAPAAAGGSSPCATARSTGSTAASTRYARTASCRPSPSRAIPTVWRWRRCGSRTSADGRTRLRTQSLVRQLRGPRRVAGAAAWRSASTRATPSSRGCSPMALSDRPAERHRQVAGLFTERVRGTRSWDAPSPVAGLDRPRRRAAT